MHPSIQSINQTINPPVKQTHAECPGPCKHSYSVRRGSWRSEGHSVREQHFNFKKPKADLLGGTQEARGEGSW